MDSKWKSLLWKAFVVISAIVAIVPMVFCAIGNPLFPDPSYFLSIMERVAEGKTLYKEVWCGYTPLWFYMMLGWKLLFHIPVGCVEAYYPLHFLMQMFSAFCLYKIVRAWNINGKIAYFCSWLFIMMSHWMDGAHLILEPSTVMFGLLAMWLVLSNKESLWYMFGSGVAVACSFLCKQYGLGFFVLLLLPVIYKNKRWLVRVLVYVSGFMLPLLVCLAIWQKNIVICTLLNGYGTSINEVNGIGFAEKMGWIMSQAMTLFKRCAYALIATLFFIPLFIREKRWPELVFCWCGIGGFLLINYLASPGLRYLLFALPFVLLLFAIALSLWNQANVYLKWFFMLLLVATTVYSLHADYRNKVMRIYMHLEYKQSQKDLSEEVKKRVGEKDLLWIPDSGLTYVYYFTNRLPPNLSTISYAFGQGMTKERAKRQVETADYVLSFDHDDLEYYFDKEMKDFVYSHVAVYSDKAKEVTLHDMSRKAME